VTSTVAVNFDRFRFIDSNLNTAFTVQAQALKARTIAADLSVNSEVTASPFNLMQLEAALTSQGFVLIAGRVLQLDPYLTYVVPQETRYYTVAPESREFIINQETRTLKL
jgi:hypothetical protein